MCSCKICREYHIRGAYQTGNTGPVVRGAVYVNEQRNIPICVIETNYRTKWQKASEYELFS